MNKKLEESRELLATESDNSFKSYLITWLLLSTSAFLTVLTFYGNHWEKISIKSPQYDFSYNRGLWHSYLQYPHMSYLPNVLIATFRIILCLALAVKIFTIINISIALPCICRSKENKILVKARLIKLSSFTEILAGCLQLSVVVGYYYLYKYQKERNPNPDFKKIEIDYYFWVILGAGCLSFLVGFLLMLLWNFDIPEYAHIHTEGNFILREHKKRGIDV